MLNFFSKLIGRNKNNLHVQIKYKKDLKIKSGWYIVSNSLGNVFHILLEPALSKVLFNVKGFNFCVDYDPKEDFETVFEKLKKNVVFFHIGKEQADTIAADRLVHFESYFLTTAQYSLFATVVDNAEYFNINPSGRLLKSNMVRYSLNSPVPDIIPVGRIQSIYYVAYGYCFHLSNYEQYIESTINYPSDLFSGYADNQVNYSFSSKFNDIALQMVNIVDLDHLKILKFNDCFCGLEINPDSIVLTGYSNLAALRQSFDTSLIDKIKKNTQSFTVSHYEDDKKIKCINKYEPETMFGSYQFRFTFKENGYEFFAIKIEEPLSFVEKKLMEDFSRIYKILDKNICLRTNYRFLEKLIERGVIDDKYSQVTQSDLDLYRMIEI